MKFWNIKPSRIPTVGFIAGGIGAVLAFGFQAWVFVIDYPIVIGGKPQLSIPAFIPVTFEFTILCAAFAMVIAFLMRSGLGLGAKNKIHDKRITDDRFVIIIDCDKQEKQFADVKQILEKEEAQNIHVNDRL